MVKRKKMRLRHGDVLDVEEYHDGNYGSPGKSRQKKEKPTREQVRQINQRNKVRRCRWRLIQYFDQGDLFITWTYEVGNRPPDMAGALKDFQNAMQKIRKIYRARGRTTLLDSQYRKGNQGSLAYPSCDQADPGG